jgi:RNA polymerase sigma-70 factor, ECF subfamily
VRAFFLVLGVPFAYERKRNWGPLRVYGVRVSGQREQSADVLSFEQFFMAEHVRLVAIAIALAPDRETAQDVAQETLARAFARWDQVRVLDQPGAWVRRILINLLIDNHRRRTREQAAVVRLLSESSTSIASADVDGFVAMIRRLPERQRVAVVLRYLDDLSIDDVAYSMNVAEGTVKALLFKARQSLSTDLARTEEVR